MIKLVFHVFFFAIGVGVGIWWGAHHPTEAGNIASNEEARIKAAVAQAKVEILGKVLAVEKTPAHSSVPGSGFTGSGFASGGSGSSSHSAEFQQMLDDQQKELDNANRQLGK